MKSKQWIRILIAAVVILAAGGGYVSYARASAAAQAPQEPEPQTATLYRR